MKKAIDTMTTEEAMIEAKKKRVSITRPTVITWIEKYKLGSKLGGRWYIDRKKYMDFLKKGLGE